MIEGLVEQFAALDEPRCAGKVEHRLMDVLVIAVCAVVAEAETFEAIVLWPLQGKLAAGLPGTARWHSFARHVPPRADADQPRCV